MSNWHTKPSTWAAVGSWAITGFMAYPSIASLLVHLCNGLMLGLIIYLAHYEGRHAR